MQWRPRLARPDGWSVAVALVALAAGLLFASSASTARGTDLRSGSRLRLPELVRAEELRAAALAAESTRLREELDAVTRLAASGDARVQAAQEAAERYAAAAGLVALEGPGLVVTLDDAPRLQPGETRDGDPKPDDLVVHEQDLHAVLNALWAGGADAVTVMGQRVIGTSSVRCVGNTLLLHGTVYSPPYALAAIGDASSLRAALDVAPGVKTYRSYAKAYGLRYDVRDVARVTAPAFAGPVELPHTREAR